MGAMVGVPLAMLVSLQSRLIRGAADDLCGERNNGTTSFVQL